MDKDKPECRLENWNFDNHGRNWERGRDPVPGYVGKVCLTGTAVGHPRMGDSWVMTTPVLGWDFENHGTTMVAYTKNTKYVLGYPASHWSYRIPRQIEEFFFDLRFYTRWHWGHLTGIGEYGLYRWPKLVDGYSNPLPGNPWLKRSKWGKVWDESGNVS
jgi:hypothetical protein